MMRRLRLILFGSPTMECDGESFALPFERRNPLLVYLALKRSWVGRADLAALLWPEQEQKLALTNLRKALAPICSTYAAEAAARVVLTGLRTRRPVAPSTTMPPVGTRGLASPVRLIPLPPQDAGSNPD